MAWPALCQRVHSLYFQPFAPLFTDTNVQLLFLSLPDRMLAIRVFMHFSEGCS